MKILESIKYCSRCCIPETQEGVTFDELGVCKACQSSEEKIHIDWNERQKKLEIILNQAKSKAGDNYDCILPISGGKDSFFQAYILVEVYKMKPLAVTFSHNWFTEIGWYNLQNLLETFNLDHLMFTPNRGLVNKVAKKSLIEIGDSCWHCHSGVGSFPLNIATKYNIPLLIWGESISESSGRSSFNCPLNKFDKDYFTKISAKLKPEEMINDVIKKRDLKPFEIPNDDELNKVGVFGIHLGDYIFWDEERQTEFIKEKFGWKEDVVEGAYKGYKSVECVMPGVHDFTCYQKRGYGRSTFQASVDVRNGLLTREEAFELAYKFDTERPDALDYFLSITGLSEEDFYKIIQSKRLEKIKDHNLPITPKINKKIIKPFFQELIEKHKFKND